MRREIVMEKVNIKAKGMYNLTLINLQTFIIEIIIIVKQL